MVNIVLSFEDNYFIKLYFTKKQTLIWNVEQFLETRL
jgi:hypothetical protein